MVARPWICKIYMVCGQGFPVEEGVREGNTQDVWAHVGAREQCGIPSLLAVALSPSLVKLGEDPKSFHQTLK